MPAGRFCCPISGGKSPQLRSNKEDSQEVFALGTGNNLNSNNFVSASGASLSPKCTANLNELQANIAREVAQIDPEMVRRATLDMKARAVKCIAAGGGHFE